jgi:hypothetical protein
VVYGSRFTADGHILTFDFWHSFGNRFLTWLSNLFSGLHLTDMEVCYKVFKRDVLNRLELTENRFGFEPEFTQKISRLGLSIREIGISYLGRTTREGKKIKWRDGFRAVYIILKYGFFS